MYFIIFRTFFVRIDGPHPKQLVAVMHQIGMPTTNTLQEEEEEEEEVLLLVS